jgi:predicted ester cyclase
MTTEDNKVIARRYFEDLFSKGNLAVATEIIAPEYEETGPNAVPGLPPGPNGSTIHVMEYRKAFPDVTFTVDEQIAEGDTVVTRWTATGTHQGGPAGIPATGKLVTVTGVSVDRVVNGKLVARWNISDQLGLLRQLGVIPS